MTMCDATSLQSGAVAVGQGLYTLASLVLPIRPQLSTKSRQYTVQVVKVGLLAGGALAGLLLLMNVTAIVAKWKPDASFFDVLDMKARFNKIIISCGAIAAAQGVVLLAMAGDDLYQALFKKQTLTPQL